MHRTPNPQPRIAGPSRKGPAHKRKDERGMALVFALMGILILSMLAAALLVVTNADALASFNYKNQIQASYAALAGVHRTVDWFRGTYSPWLNPTTGGTPDAATDPPVTASEYGGTPNAPTFSSNPVVLGDSANFPTVASNTISSNFNTMRNSLNTISLGDATGDFTIRDVTLLSHDRYKAFDGVTDRIVERWRLRVQGRVRNAVGTELAVVEETAVLQMGPLPIFGNALHGQCSLEMNGALITDSFDSSNGLYGGSNLFTGEDARASVASNSFTGSSGSSGVINGDLYYGAVPDAAGGCTSSGESADDSIVQGDVEEYPPAPKAAKSEKKTEPVTEEEKKAALKEGLEELDTRQARAQGNMDWLQSQRDGLRAEIRALEKKRDAAPTERGKVAIHAQVQEKRKELLMTEDQFLVGRTKV